METTSEVKVTRIPLPSVILKGDWQELVYAIDTRGGSRETHEAEVEEKVSKIKGDFDDASHYTVSLREVRRELVYADDFMYRYCTLVQFRVRDSY
jgi:hypothetical protein